eukprot:s8813_g2.t2
MSVQPPAQLVHASLRSLQARVFVIDSRMAVKSRRWPGLDGASTQAVAAWPDPGAELREEQGLVLEGCTASVSSDEMSVHLSGRWEFRVRPCEALNELGYAGRNRHELLESFDVPPLLVSVQGCPQHRPSSHGHRIPEA